MVLQLAAVGLQVEDHPGTAALAVAIEDVASIEGDTSVEAAIEGAV